MADPDFQIKGGLGGGGLEGGGVVLPSNPLIYHFRQKRYSFQIPSMVPLRTLHPL